MGLLTKPGLLKVGNGVYDGVEFGNPDSGRLAVDARMSDIRVGQVGEVQA